MVPISSNWYYQPQGNSTNYLQGTGSGTALQGSSGNTLQAGTSSIQGSSPQLQATANPYNYVDPEASGTTSSTSVTDPAGAVDPAAAAAAAKAAEDAAKANALRGQITQTANTIRDIFNSRYGLVDAAAKDQSGKLDSRFKNESSDVVRLVGEENEKVGAAHSASGSYDSSYRGNNVDTVKRGGEAQIRDLGEELSGNRAKIGDWASKEKAGFNASKSGIDLTLSRLAETSDLGELTSLRNNLDSRITELRAGDANYQTGGQSLATLETIAPSSARAVSLKTTLSQVLAGNADASLKGSIGAKLIASAGLNEEDAQALLAGFQGSLSTQEQTTA